MGKKFYITEAIIELEPDESGKYGMSNQSDLQDYIVRGRDIYILDILYSNPNSKYHTMYETMYQYIKRIIEVYGKYKIDKMSFEKIEEMYPITKYNYIEIDTFTSLVEELLNESFSETDYITPQDDEKIPYVTGADGVFHLHIINNRKYGTIRTAIVEIINKVSYLKPIYSEPYGRIKNQYDERNHYLVNTLMDMASMINGDDDDHMINLQKA